MYFKKQRKSKFLILFTHNEICMYQSIFTKLILGPDPETLSVELLAASEMVKRFKLELLPAKIFPGIHTTWPTTIREALYTSQNRRKITKIHHRAEISTEMDTYQVPTQTILLGRVVIGWFQRKMDYMVSFELAWNI